MTNLESKVWELHSQTECCAPELGIIEDPEDIYTPSNVEPTHERRERFLDEVCDLINGDREKEYGPAVENFQRIAELWAAYHNSDFTIYDVAAMLALLKIARLANRPSNPDSWKDLAGYATLGGTL